MPSSNAAVEEFDEPWLPEAHRVLRAAARRVIFGTYIGITLLKIHEQYKLMAACLLRTAHNHLWELAHDQVTMFLRFADVLSFISFGFALQGAVFIGLFRPVLQEVTDIAVQLHGFFVSKETCFGRGKINWGELVCLRTTVLGSIWMAWASYRRINPRDVFCSFRGPESVDLELIGHI